MSKNQTTKTSHKNIFLWIGIGLACAVLLKRDTPQIKA